MFGAVGEGGEVLSAVLARRESWILVSGVWGEGGGGCGLGCELASLGR